MRALIVLSVMATIFSSNVCEAGMSTGPHKVLAPTRSAPVARHVATNHRREGRPVHQAHAHAPGILGPVAAVGGAIGNTLGGLFRR
jgi:hypothetical protein